MVPVTAPKSGGQTRIEIAGERFLRRAQFSGFNLGEMIGWCLQLLLHTMEDECSLSPPPLEHLNSEASTTSSTSVNLPSAQALVPLHGVTLGKLLSNRGEAFYYKKANRFRRRRQSELLYTLSEPVEMLDEFVSHSWSADPNVVVWTMQLRINFCLAVALSTICSIIFSWGFDMDPALCTIIGIIIYITLLRRGHEIPLKISGVQRRRDAKVFFDRCCIDQVDPIRKAAGIRSIGAYLNKCDTFLLLWSDDYFQRLWCVFELACFLKGSEKMGKQRPLKLFMMPIQKTIYRCLITTTVYWLFLSLIPSSLQFPFDILMCVIRVRFVFLANISSRIKMRYSLSDIDFDTVQCTEPSDRAMILDLIEEWYGNLEKFKAYVSDTMCLAAQQAVSTDRIMLFFCCVSQPALIYGLAYKDFLNPALYACRIVFSLLLVTRVARRLCGVDCSNSRPHISIEISIMYQILSYTSAVIVCVVVDLVGSRYLETKDSRYDYVTISMISVLIILFTPVLIFSSTVSSFVREERQVGHRQQRWKWLVNEYSV